MSNFAFMNNSDILRSSTAYKKMYEFALAAESSFYGDKQVFCIYSRFVLEQFCEFVVDYSRSRSYFSGNCDGVGWYWSRRCGNYDRMVQLVRGDAQLSRMKKINDVTKIICIPLAGCSRMSVMQTY